jgi:hypothetical protein
MKRQRGRTGLRQRGSSGENKNCQIGKEKIRGGYMSKANERGLKRAKSQKRSLPYHKACETVGFGSKV